MYNRVRTQIRNIVGIAFLATLAFSIFTSASHGADDKITIIHVNAHQTSGEVEKILEAAKSTGKPVLVEWDNDAAPSTAATTKTNDAASHTNSTTSPYNDIENALTRGNAIILTGLYGLPEAFQSSWLSLINEGEGLKQASYTTLIALLYGVVAASILLFLFNRLIPDVQSHHSPLAKAWTAAFRLMGDLLALAVFLFVVHISINLPFSTAPFASETAQDVLHVLTMIAVFAAAGRLLFHHNGSAGPLLGIANPGWYLAMTMGFGALSGAIEASMNFADSRGLDPTAAQGWHLLGSTILTIYKLVWLAVGHKDIASVFAGPNANSTMRAAGKATVYFFGLSAVLIWLLGFFVVGTSHNIAWARMAGVSQIIFLLMPKLGLGISALFRHFGDRHAALNGSRPLSVLLWAIRIPLAGACWILGLQLIITLWQPLLEDAGMTPAVWLAHIRQFGFAMIAGWFACNFFWKYFEAVAPKTDVKLPGQDDDTVEEATSRLSTILPIVRNLVLGAVISVAALATLSSLGVDIAPLMAGFGVLGLALSFGSQTLVKDVVSGIFFLAEDAFRIGEYIDTGKLKGTVEQITLRSVRLRHQNGPIHTIPFGQIAAVTNFSRDWGTVKFELRFDRDADLEAIRKTTKKVGLELLEHPDFGNEFLIPLKMQGIQDITENSMVIRFKFTSRPGNPSIIKREAIKRLLEVYKAAGVNLASNAVVVRNGNNNITLDAAAASLATPVAISSTS
jgi:moderate conductance mechanosensitive channel